MTSAVITGNIDKAQVGPDKNILPDYAGIIKWINGDTESLPFSVKGFRGIGIIDPGTIVGPTLWAVHVAATKDGLYAPLSISPYTAGTLQAYGTSFGAEWNYAKILANATVTTGGDMPFCLS